MSSNKLHLSQKCLEESEQAKDTPKIEKYEGKTWRQYYTVVPPPQESMDNSPNLFDYGLDDPYNDLINDFDPYLKYGKRYQNRTAFEDAFYR